MEEEEEEYKFLIKYYNSIRSLQNISHSRVEITVRMEPSSFVRQRNVSGVPDELLIMPCKRRKRQRPEHGSFYNRLNNI